MNFRGQLRIETLVTGVIPPVKVKEDNNCAIRRRKSLKRFDYFLSKSNFKAALSVLKDMQGKPGGLRGFGTAKQVPKRLGALNELEFDGIDLWHLRPLVDSVLNSIQSQLQFDLLDEDQITETESLMHGEGRESTFVQDHSLCQRHEAGHFLVGYLLGALPKGYKVPSIEDLRHANVTKGRVEFWYFQFRREIVAAQNLNRNITRGQACDWTLNQLSCIKLGGLVAEHLVFGRSKGSRTYVKKLDAALKWFGFSEREANFQVRWPTLNTVFILNRHLEARSRLVEAMAQGQSVAFCINVIEDTLDGKEMIRASPAIGEKPVTRTEAIFLTVQRPECQLRGMSCMQSIASKGFDQNM